MKKLLSVVLCAILILNCLLACVSCDMGELLEDPEETKVNKNENTQKNEQTADIATEIDTEENTDKPTNVETQTLAESNTGAVEQTTDTAASSEYTTEYVFEDVSVCPHEYGDYEAVNEASCTQNGLSQRVCGICGKSQQKEIIANGHEFSSWDIIRSIGGDTYECTRFCYECGVTEQKVISFADGGTATSFSGGDGTEGNPYIISSAAELYWLAYTVNSFVYEGYNDAHYILTNDIYLGGYEWEPIGVYYFDDGSNIDKDKDMTFSGTFDGNGHTIYGLTITEYEDYHEFFGLFGSLEEGAVIKNLNMEYFNISIDSDKEIYIGGIAGCSKEASIENCHVDGSITVYSGREDAYVGGFVGKNSYTSIDSCSAKVNVDATSSNSGGGDLHIGGLIGEVVGSDITNSYSSGSIYARADYYVYIGGFIGEIRSGNITIDHCYSNCSVSTELYGAEEYSIGGFIGEVYTTANVSITNSYSTGDVSANSKCISVGGFIGEMNGANIIVQDSYATGDVYAYSSEYAYVGGFVGQMNKATTKKCFAAGMVKTVLTQDEAYSCVGGFAGYFKGENAIISDCFGAGDVLSEENGISSVGGLVGKCNNASIEYSSGLGDVVALNGYAGGLVGEFKGSVKHCYSLSNVISIGCIEGRHVYGGGLIGEATSTANISLSYSCGDVWTISQGINIMSEAGGLIGHCSGNDVKIENCHASGNIRSNASGESSHSYAGGLVGHFSSSGTIDKCLAFGDVTAISDYEYTDAFAGGLIGSSNGDISNCVTFGSARAINAYEGGKTRAYRLIGNAYQSLTTSNLYNYDESYAFVNDVIIEGMQQGMEISKDKLNDKNFYIDDLGFNEKVWKLTDLDIDNEKIPKFN